MLPKKRKLPPVEVDLSTLKGTKPSLAPGFYRLTQPVKPSNIDRRLRAWYSQPEIPAGKIFRVTWKNFFGTEVLMLNPKGEHRYIEERYSGDRTGCIQECDIVAELLPFLEKIPVGLDEVVDREDPKRILQTLIETGKITLKELDQMFPYKTHGSPKPE